MPLPSTLWCCLPKISWLSLSRLYHRAQFLFSTRICLSSVYIQQSFSKIVHKPKSFRILLQVQIFSRNCEIFYYSLLYTQAFIERLLECLHVSLNGIENHFQVCNLISRWHRESTLFCFMSSCAPSASLWASCPFLSATGRTHKSFVSLFYTSIWASSSEPNFSCTIIGSLWIALQSYLLSHELTSYCQLFSSCLLDT